MKLYKVVNSECYFDNGDIVRKVNKDEYSNEVENSITFAESIGISKPDEVDVYERESDKRQQFMEEHEVELI